MNAVMMRAFRDELSKIAAVGGLAGMDPVRAGAGIGALAAFGLQYMANKAPKGGKSVQQKIFEKKEQEINYDAKVSKKEGKKPSFYGKVQKITAKPMSQLATLATKHPVQAAIPAAILGANAGAIVAKHLFK